MKWLLSSSSEIAERTVANRYLRLFKLQKYNYRNHIEKDSSCNYSLHMLNMKRANQKAKMKSISRIPSFVTLQVIGTGSYGGGKSLFMCTEYTKYLFNCGEGTQRIAHEYRFKLSKLEHIFVTSTSWENIGGIPGMLLTLHDSIIQTADIHCPKGTHEVINSITKFTSSKTINPNIIEHNNDDVFCDNTMTVFHVLITPQIIKDTLQDAEIIIEDKNDSNGKRRLNDNRIDKRVKLKDINKSTEELNKKAHVSASCYICKLHDRPGSLNLKKCVEKGITPGPTLALLKSGQDVVLPDGTIVKSKEVCGKSAEGPVFIIVDCPSKDFLESLVNHTAFVKYQISASEKVTKPYCMIHFAPQEVIDDPQYMEWINKFDSDVCHIILNEKNKCQGSEAVYKNQYMLHLLHPQIFPLLNEDDVPKRDTTLDETNVDNEQQVVKCDSTNEDQRIRYARTCDMIHLTPNKYVDTSAGITIDPKEYIAEALCNKELSNHLEELRINIASQTELLGKINDYPKLVILGTGSGKPSKTRNTSALMLRVNETCNIIMDCGEGTLCQITRMYNKSEREQILINLKAIYISHIHADHHFGLIGILKERAKFTQTPLYLLIPPGLFSWLTICNNIVKNICDQYILIRNYDLLLNQHKEEEFKHDELYKALNLKAIDTVFVRHCQHAYGVALTLDNGYKIVYSGDCLPSEDLIELGKNCDLLIHEATMEDGMENLANSKRHSTVSQAISIGKRMNAGFILLTHFSQRYAKIQILPKNKSSDELKNVGIAYDYMDLNLAYLPLIPLFYPSLMVMFNEYFSILEERAIKLKKNEKIN